MDKEKELKALVDRIGQLGRLIAHSQQRKATLEFRLNRLMATYEVPEVKGRWYETARIPGKQHVVAVARSGPGTEVPFPDSENVVALGKKNPNFVKKS